MLFICLVIGRAEQFYSLDLITALYTLTINEINLLRMLETTTFRLVQIRRITFKFCSYLRLQKFTSFLETLIKENYHTTSICITFCITFVNPSIKHILHYIAMYMSKLFVISTSFQRLLIVQNIVFEYTFYANSLFCRRVVYIKTYIKRCLWRSKYDMQHRTYVCRSHNWICRQLFMQNI